jgi:hypothetical protein
METLATFSIIDHRKPIYRQALALFDRIVVSLPPKSIGDQTQEELDQPRGRRLPQRSAGQLRNYLCHTPGTYFVCTTKSSTKRP